MAPGKAGVDPNGGPDDDSSEPDSPPGTPQSPPGAEFGFGDVRRTQSLPVGTGIGSLTGTGGLTSAQPSSNGGSGDTGGGLMAFGHPVGATGVKQIHEIFRQMKGQCGDYQMAKVPEFGLTVNMGGDDKTIVSMALKNLG